MNIHTDTPPVNTIPKAITPHRQALRDARDRSTARGRAKGLNPAEIEAAQAPINKAFNDAKDRSTPERCAALSAMLDALWPAEAKVIRLPSQRADDFQLIANDFNPIVCVGKRPVSDGWQRGSITRQRIVAKRLRRSDVVEFFAKLAPCTVGIEACASAHYWAREIGGLGHTVKLMPPAYVKAYVKRGKNDASDAEAICEAVQRPTMRFVPVKSAAQQASGMIYKIRELLVRQRAQATNAFRSHLSELGIVAAQGRSKLADLIDVVHDANDGSLPAAARMVLQELAGQIEALSARIERLDEAIVAQVRSSEAGRRLTSIPGIGPITAGALLAMVPDPGSFRSARHFATWLGFAPRQKSSGGKQRLGSISKQGNRYLRGLLILGAANVLRFMRKNAISAWLAALRERRPFKVVAVALAHKMARIVWALMVRGGVYRAAPAAVATS